VQEPAAEDGQQEAATGDVQEPAAEDGQQEAATGDVQDDVASNSDPFPDNPTSKDNSPSDNSSDGDAMSKGGPELQVFPREKGEHWENAVRTPSTLTDENAREIYDESEKKLEGSIPEDFYDKNTKDILWPEKNGFLGYPQEVTLKEGYVFSRIGSARGRFAAPVGTQYGERSLPYSEEAAIQEERIYKVLKPIEKVLEGLTAPYFQKPGFGLQQELPNPIQYLIENGSIEDITDSRPELRLTNINHKEIEDYASFKAYQDGKGHYNEY